MKGTRYIYTGNSLESVLVPKAVSVGYARRDKRESRPGAETSLIPVSDFQDFKYKQTVRSYKYFFGNAG